MRHRRLDMRIFTTWWTLFLAFEGLFVALFAVIEAAQNESLWESGLGAGLAGRLPLFSMIALPAASLVASIVLAVSMSRRGETLAAWAAGVSPWRLARGVAVAALPLLPISWSLMEWAVPAALQRTPPPDPDAWHHVAWLEADGSLLTVRQASEDRWEGVSRVYLNDSGSAVARLDAYEAVSYDAARRAWRVRRGARYVSDGPWHPVAYDTSLPAWRDFARRARLLAAGVETWKDPLHLARYTTPQLARRVADATAAAGTAGAAGASSMRSDLLRWTLEIHRRRTYPWLPSLLALFGFWASLSAERRVGMSGALGRGLLLVVVAEVLYRGFDAVTRFLAASAPADLTLAFGAWGLPLFWFAAALTAAGRAGAPAGATLLGAWRARRGDAPRWDGRR